MSGLANPNEEKENTGGAAASTSNDSAPKEKKGGLGRDKASRKFESATAEERAAANSDGRFGYYDMTNKRYVPAFFDMFDGGGRDTRGDEFKGGLLSNALNKLGIDPYGSQRERMFVAPNTSSAIQAAVQGGGAPQRSVPTVVDSVVPRLRPEAGVTGPPMPADALSPLMVNQSLPTYDEVQAQNMNVNPYAVGAGFEGEFEPSRIVADGNAAPMPAPTNMPQPLVLSQLVANQGNADEMRLNTASTNSQPMGLDVDPAMMGELNTSINLLRANQPNMADPSAFSANAPSAAAMTAPTPAPADRNPQLAAFNQAMSTVPAMLKGTQIEDMYRDHLLNGGGGTFAQFTGAQ